MPHLPARELLNKTKKERYSRRPRLLDKGSAREMEICMQPIDCLFAF